MRCKSHVRFCRVTVKKTYLSTFPLSPQKNQTLPYVKLPEYD
uniref:ORF41n n=1 Tax=Pinus koraiensis TaxID=88728 RepID=A4QMF4_PINKO|nr:ORF41n [Pinus koraiensis]ABP35491.1 ORF41n [Pinus koraiensis]